MENRIKVGLALGGGVARGLAHIGVLCVLRRAGIPIDYVAGTSAGSLVGGIYCTGLDLDELYRIGLRLQWWHLARPTWPARGFVTFDPLARWIRRLVGDLQFSQLQTPFAAIATDLDTGEPVPLTHGPIAPAIQASCSVPGFVAPVMLDDRMLGDGSLSDTLPVKILRQMGADFVIGVDIFTSSIRPRWGPFGMGFTAMEILVRRAGGGIEDADCLITPDLGGKTYLRFSKRQEMYQLGLDAAEEKVACLRQNLGLGHQLPEAVPAF